MYISLNVINKCENNHWDNGLKGINCDSRQNIRLNYGSRIKLILIIIWVFICPDMLICMTIIVSRLIIIVVGINKLSSGCIATTW